MNKKISSIRDAMYCGKNASIARNKPGITIAIDGYEFEEPKYRKDEIRIGYQKFSHLGKVYVNEYVLDMGESHVYIVGGKRGSGKTFIARRLVDVVYETRKSIVIIADVKNEYYTSRYPADTKFYSQLAKNEVPRGIPIEVVYPKYLGEPPEGCMPFNFSLQDFTYTDFESALNMASGASSQQISTLQTLFRVIKDKRLKSINDAIEELKELENIHSASKRSIENSLINLMHTNFVGEDFNIDIAKILNEGKVLVLCIQDYERWGKHLASTAIAIFSRKLFQLRRQREIKNKLFVLVDEAHEFCNRLENLDSKSEVLRLAKEGRADGISVLLLTQELTDIPENFIIEARYILLPYNISFEVMKQVLKDRGIYNPRDYYDADEITSLRRQMKSSRHQRQWICVDEAAHSLSALENNIFWPYAPMSKHKTEED